MKNYSVGDFTCIDSVYSAHASTINVEPSQLPISLGITHRSGFVSKFYFVSDSIVNGQVVAFIYAEKTDVLPAKLVLFNN
jgi:hypothetical protein